MVTKVNPSEYLRLLRGRGAKSPQEIALYSISEFAPTIKMRNFLGTPIAW
jgi:hypothetical protein